MDLSPDSTSRTSRSGPRTSRVPSAAVSGPRDQPGPQVHKAKPARKAQSALGAAGSAWPHWSPWPARERWRRRGDRTAWACWVDWARWSSRGDGSAWYFRTPGRLRERDRRTRYLRRRDRTVPDGEKRTRRRRQHRERQCDYHNVSSRRRWLERQGVQRWFRQHHCRNLGRLRIRFLSRS